VPDPTVADRPPIELRKGLPSAAVDPPAGCRFLGRCPLRIDVCSQITPELVEAEPAHGARCHVTAPSPSIREESHVDPIH
jgi:oligopeptide/dipeptide ABC transporter ATP-binding protein